jgi:hypothetical protein
MVEGYREAPTWDHKNQYGSIWHEGEEAHAAGRDPTKAMASYVNKLIDEYSESSKDILRWFYVAKTQFPLYLAHWKANDPDQKRRKPLYQEKEFRVPYSLPSGRTIILRGKIDSLFALGKQVYEQENKTKGDIDVEGLQATVAENLQTMFYQVVMRELAKQPGFFPKGYRPVGVLYNVVRRPLSDRFAIRQKVSETDKQFYARLGSVIKEKADYYFYRWKIEVDDADVERFKKQIFHPILEQLCGWWQSIRHHPFDPWQIYLPDDDGKYVPKFPNNFHWRSPFGVYNSLGLGYRGDFFKYLTYGNKSDLVRTNDLFPELNEGK